MSMKPEDIPQWAWDKAFDALPPVVAAQIDASPLTIVLREAIAKAILSAVEEENEACAKLCDTFAGNALDFATEFRKGPEHVRTLSEKGSIQRRIRPTMRGHKNRALCWAEGDGD